jgi:hypothetical protein
MFDCVPYTFTEGNVVKTLFMRDYWRHVTTDDNITTEEWRRLGALHSYDDMPARVLRIDNKIATEEWYENGKNHRHGKPAAIYYRDGARTEYWYEDGKLTTQIRYKDGQKDSELRYVNGKWIEKPIMARLAEIEADLARLAV